jgi:hypothetical protein
MMNPKARTAQRLAVLTAVCLAAARGAAAGEGGDPLVIDGSDHKRAYDCGGRAAIVNGGDNVLSLRKCTELTVNGGDNMIDAGVVGAITATGAGNRITWTEAPDGKRPRIRNLGDDNLITSRPAAATRAPARDRPARLAAPRARTLRRRATPPLIRTACTTSERSRPARTGRSPSRPYISRRTPPARHPGSSRTRVRAWSACN